MLQESQSIIKDIKIMKSKFLSLCFMLLLIQAKALCLESEINTIGSIQPSSKSLISTQVAGRVEDIFVDVGHHVKKGQPIVQLDKRYYAIDLAQKSAALETAKIERDDAEKNFARMKKLWEKPEGETPSIPLKRLEDAQLKYSQSVAQVKQAEENFNRAQLYLEETTIKSPYDGIITKKFVDVGDSIPVQPVTNMMEIQAMDPLYLEFCVPQIYSTYLKIGSPVSFEIDGVDLKNTAAKIDLFYPILDEATRSLRCRAVLDNKEGKIRPGSLAKVSIKADLPGTL